MKSLIIDLSHIFNVSNAEWVGRLAIEYAEKNIGDRWPEAEQYLIKNPRLSVLYASRVIKHRWVEASNYWGADYNMWEGDYRWT